MKRLDLVLWITTRIIMNRNESHEGTLLWQIRGDQFQTPISLSFISSPYWMLWLQYYELIKLKEIPCKKTILAEKDSSFPWYPDNGSNRKGHWRRMSLLRTNYMKHWTLEFIEAELSTIPVHIVTPSKTNGEQILDADLFILQRFLKGRLLVFIFWRLSVGLLCKYTRR